MNKSLGFALVLLASFLTLSCGSSSSTRQLQSITVQATVNGEVIQFTATGTFSAPPTTVSPLPASWYFDLPGSQYTLTTQPFSYSCAAPPSPGPLIATAPADPNAPSSGSTLNTKMIIGSAPIICP